MIGLKNFLHRKEEIIMADKKQSAELKLKRNFSFAEILAFLLISGQIALYGFMWFRLLKDPSLKTMDFISFYAVGRLIRADEYGQIYDFESEAVVQQQLVGGDYESPLIFNHPPYVTPLLGLIASDDYVRAFIYWSVIRLLALLACEELIRRYLIRSGWENLPAWLGALGGITFFPIFISLLGGQDTVFTLTGLLVWMLALLKGEEISAGLGLAFASLTPTIAGALALPLFAARRRAGLWFLAGMLGLAGYSFLLVGTQGIMDFLALLGTSSQGSHYGINWSAMYNLLGMLARALPNPDIEILRSIAWVFSGLSIFSISIFWWNKAGRLSARHIGIAVVLGTFTSPHLHLHGLSFLLLPLLGLITIFHDRGNKKAALILIPIVSSILVIILFLLPAWSFSSYYLLMGAMLIGFAALKPSTKPRNDLPV